MLDEVHVMLDLETWGTAAGSAIRSIGAVVFCPVTGELGNEFYTNVSDGSCLDAGLVKDPGTVAWWGKQSKAAQDSLMADPLPLADALRKFTTFFTGAEGEYLWSQGGNFDEPLLNACYKAAKMRAPWKFHNSRDTRTIYHLGESKGFNSFAIKRKGTYHNALDDAKHQVVCVVGAYKAIFR